MRFQNARASPNAGVELKPTCTPDWPISPQNLFRSADSGRQRMYQIQISPIDAVRSVCEAGLFRHLHIVQPRCVSVHQRRHELELALDIALLRLERCGLPNRAERGPIRRREFVTASADAVVARREFSKD